MQDPKTHTTENAVKLVGEVLVPGASQFMDGNILSGGAHMIVGAWARVALGPVGLALVIANSYANSTTGKGLLGQFTKDSDSSTHETKTKSKAKSS